MASMQLYPTRWSDPLQQPMQAAAAAAGPSRSQRADSRAAAQQHRERVELHLGLQQEPRPLLAAQM